ncbi:hypothetical protein CLV59_10648 [Chitinophaga dinghuensis]|uniref:Uncharacterized protein n=1 Tax=Chitinophaga dinghuensis TaxID=1539050 RepID=A0A327W251_9BACT|nr:hypothetical protein [Chitinophaga dinghuensis]RAJ78988.1 hypothetical protein CLV59_10648 [Chitinophaga dinghuensis]
MELVVPFKNYEDAMATLDNGGRFYNLFNHADDQIISQAEVGKAAGVFIGKQQGILFLELATSELSESARKDIFSKFDQELQHNYTQYKPVQLLPSEVGSKGTLGASIIIEGIPQLVDAKTVFKGYNIILVVNTLIPVPIAESYDVYEIKDANTGDTFIIANSKEKKKLPEQKVKVGGILTELNDSKEKFLEVNYYVVEDK